MKKKMIMLVAAAMMTLSASSAFAAFADLELIRVVYERGGATEQLTDLGKVTTILAGGTQTFAGATLTATTPANLYAAYFAYDKLTGQVWTSGSTDTTLAPVAVGFPGSNFLKNASPGVYNYYNGASVTTGANGVKTGLQANTSSFKFKINGSAGSLGNTIDAATRPYTEISLGSLVGLTTGSVAQNLYFLDGLTIGNIGQVVASITTNANGSTTIAPTSATPIPPAFFLMGSGLLGMFGLRRKNKVA